jgi:antitoxin HigA-1
MQHRIRINDQWRLCFNCVAGDAFDVEITDYHEEGCMMKSGLPAIHPGEFLAETLDELGLSQAAFARAIGVSQMRVSHVVKGTRPITAELALRLGRAFAQSPEYWLNLQSQYDLKRAQAKLGRRLSAVAALARRKRPVKRPAAA